MGPDLESADDGYEPCGVEQIAQDEARLRQDADSGLGASWGLRALGHHLRSEPELVERTLQSVVTHADPRIVVSAASILARVLLDGVPLDQLVSPVAVPIVFAIPDEVDADDRAAWQENVKVASAFVSAHAARDAGAIRRAASLLGGPGAFEVLVVLVDSAARKLERHAAWFGEALRSAEPSRDAAPSLADTDES
ncbi:hypothetical protein C8D87_11655 [Lentzea atacamensis]|uniref:HEAT repeat-containing protein n=1 Tax=Lentzea atacamensis TaxID=531938 RepID=A0ABX9DV97_9PSEU|nr:hypothetical protein [Lentzea atacamensis]RAS59002.1 hypothetical protein C8D87_11655 [Lentzea atacamensis]